MFILDSISGLLTWALSPFRPDTSSTETRELALPHAFAAEIYGRPLLAFQFPAAEPLD